MPKDRDETPEQKAERKAAKKSKRAAEGKPEAEDKKGKAAKKAEKRKAEAQSLDFFAPLSGEPSMWRFRAHILCRIAVNVAIVKDIESK
jgi:membrane protein involved in colicin uptake